MKINVLGTEYTVTVKKYEEDEKFEWKSVCGYCDAYMKQIVICDMTTWPGWELVTQEKALAAQKSTLRHELVHAFLNESGLIHSAVTYDGAWAQNEEMVDWWAIQGPKVYRAWQQAGAL